MLSRTTAARNSSRGPTPTAADICLACFRGSGRKPSLRPRHVHKNAARPSSVRAEQFVTRSLIKY
jgi:hypothetical protein